MSTRRRMTRVLQVASVLPSLLVLSACTGSAPAASPTVSAIASTAPAPTAPASTAPAPAAPASAAPPSPAASSADGTSAMIGFGSIGAVTIAMTAIEVGQQLDARTDRQDVGTGCATATYEGGGAGAQDALIGALSVLAESEGAAGPVDVLELGVLRGVAPEQQADLPATEAGIGLGSTLEQVRDAYGDDLVESQGAYDEQSVDAVVTGPGGTAIVFHIEGDGVVSGIATGRLPQVRYVEHCL